MFMDYSSLWELKQGTMFLFSTVLALLITMDTPHLKIYLKNNAWETWLPRLYFVSLYVRKVRTLK